MREGERETEREKEREREREREMEGHGWKRTAWGARLHEILGVFDE